VKNNALVSVGSLCRGGTSVASDGITLSKVLEVRERNTENAIDNLLS
jgi:hypothetical protein